MPSYQQTKPTKFTFSYKHTCKISEEHFCIAKTLLNFLLIK